MQPNDKARADIEAMNSDPNWFTAGDYYSRNDLKRAGFKGALSPEIQDSRDNPQRYFGKHAFINFAKHPDYQAMLEASATGDAAILCFVGSFAPIHDGHLAAMAAADEAVRRRGLKVIGAAFAPHSEEEVTTKIVPHHADALIASAARHAEFNDRMPSHLDSGTPVLLDMWNAYLPGTRSFTDVTTRLKRTLEVFGLFNVEVIYVLGGDNAASLMAFAAYGHVVCVRRPGYESATLPFEQDPRLRKGIREGRIIICDRDDQTVISSTQLRELGPGARREIPTRNTLGLTDDAVLLRDHPDRQVWLSPSTRTVTRLGRLEGSENEAGPTNVAQAHRLGHELSTAGLSFLGPVAPLPVHQRGLVLSTWPACDTLDITGWYAGEPTQLGRNMAAWASVRIDSLRALDIPGYTKQRIETALGKEQQLAELAAETQEWIDNVAARFPWNELMAERALVHGDPNLGNLVRHNGAVKFIDLDTVATGPTGFDLGVMEYYVRRFAVDYPATEILTGYRSVEPLSPDRLEALVAWKEASALTQLLARGGDEEITELRLRLTVPDRRWANVVGAPMGTNDALGHTDAA